MLVSYQWLQTFFTEPLPAPAELAELLNKHSLEVETVAAVGEDTVLDLDVMPDKSAWLLSHRGVARELAVILNRALVNDPLAAHPVPADLIPMSKLVTVATETTNCDYYSVAVLKNIKVAPSPDWLQTFLHTIGQRPINNIVDITNYIMYGLGQPLHAFDANKLGGEKKGLLVRPARAAEKFTSLTGEERSLVESDTVIADQSTGAVLALGGVKGGLETGTTEETTTIILEAAHFDRAATRHTAKRHRIPTDAAKRYENGVVKDLAVVGLQAAVQLITEITGGELEGYAVAGETRPIKRAPVTVSVEKINRVLGLEVTLETVREVFDRFGYQSEYQDQSVTIVPPWERDDLVIAEDLIEEFGRIYGLDHIEAIPPAVATPSGINQRFYYAEQIRQALVGLGFSEVYTSSFRDHDQVQVLNALASDKGYLRSSLLKNLEEARQRNIPQRDLLGLTAIKIFEIGTVFYPETEDFQVGLAVQTGTAYKAKVDDPLLAEARLALEMVLGVKLDWRPENGLVEFSLDKLITTLPTAKAYREVTKTETVTYRSFSTYPAVSRDISLWATADTDPETVVGLIESVAGKERVRTTLVDEFAKEGKVSYAFRLVFQAADRTLTDAEVNGWMEDVYQAVAAAGFETR